MHRARADFRANAGLQDGEEIALAVQLAHTQLDNLQHQLRHMNDIMHTNTLTHNAPKPSRMYADSAAAAAVPKGARAYSTTSRTLAEPAVAAPAAPTATPVSMFGAAGAAAAAPAGSVAMPSWMGQSATPGAAPTAGDAAAVPADSLFAAPVSVTATHTVHVRLTPNNTICTLTDLNGATKCWTSSGSVGFKNSKKSTYMACIAAGEQLGLKAKQQNIRNIDMNIAGFHKNKRAVLKGLIKAGLNIVTIRDTTPIPFNGCKPRKMRRL